MKILNRYAAAIHAKTLKPDPRSVWSDLDVLGAAGLAAKTQPLGIALARMLSGGGHQDVIDSMAHVTYERSHRMKVEITQAQAIDIATAVLSWYRFGTCNHCRGIGYQIIKGTPSLGQECKRCKGSGKIEFEGQFPYEWRDLASWLAGEIERTKAQAGDTAMRRIANNLDFV